MKNALVSALLLIGAAICAQGQRDALATAKASPGARNHESQQLKSMDYDRLEMLSRFLRSVYPDLAEEQGLSTLQISFAGGIFQMASFSFEFHPCRMSGVSSPPSPTPYCGVPTEKLFLNASVGLGPDKHRPFIFGFNASGSFIDAKLQALRDQFKGRAYANLDLRDKQRYWTEDDALKALQSSNPKYGPDHKKEFLASLPSQAIEETTGCKLHVESAEFEVRLWGPPHLQWTVRGRENATETQPEADCWAMFEPFGGPLNCRRFLSPACERPRWLLQNPDYTHDES